MRAGERSIKIWAPCPPSKRQLLAWRDAGGNPDERPRTRWRLVSVFAQDQVDPLPPPAAPMPLTPPVREVIGDSHARLLERLIELASDVGYVVEVCDTGQPDGTCNHKTRVIKLAERLEPNGRLATLVHELAHAMVAGELGDRRTDTFDYASEELVVESIAFCCCQTVGLETSHNSIPYLASWAETASTEVLEQAAQLTGRIADRIDGVLLADTDTVDVEVNGEGPDPVELPAAA